MPQPSGPPPTAAPASPTAFSVQAPSGLIQGAPAEVYQGVVAQRRELRSQQSRLEEQRQELRGQLQGDDGAALAPADRAGLEARLTQVDARIASLEQQLAQADAAVAQAAALPGATVEPIRSNNGPPDEIVAIPIVFTLFVLAPIAIAYARRIWKRGAPVATAVPNGLADRLEAMGHTMESIAIEVERIGEGQRFLTRVMSEKGKSIGAGPAEPIPVPQAHGEQVAVPRYER